MWESAPDLLPAVNFPATTRLHLDLDHPAPGPHLRAGRIARPAARLLLAVRRPLGPLARCQPDLRRSYVYNYYTDPNPTAPPPGRGRPAGAQWAPTSAAAPNP
jgi:hypothetical protein